MPTAARLAAALCLAATGWYASELIKPLFDPDKSFGFFSLVNGALGFVIGWRVIGSRAGRGLTAAINNGLTAGVVLVFWGLFTQGAYKMTMDSMRGRFDGAFDATGAVFENMAEFGLMMLTPQIIGCLVIGSCLSGLVSEWLEGRAF